MAQIQTGKMQKFLTVFLCFWVAFFEGFDLQAPGIAAKGIAETFALDQVQMGYVFSLGVFGMLFGAFFGGRVADYLGQKKVLMLSIAIFGLFMSLTAIAPSVEILYAARFFTGLGLGAAMPTMISVVGDEATEANRGKLNSLMYCGLPVGAIFVAGLAILFKDISWHTLFLIGGLTPLVLLPFMAIILKDKPKKIAVEQVATEAVPSMVQVLFKHQQYKYTMPLWVGFFFTLMINYILISWLPNLLMEQGLEKPQAFMVMLVFQVGAVIGTLALGYLLDRLKLWQMAAIIYTGLFIALVLLFTSTSIPVLILAGFMGGIFSTGGQSILYGISPIFYSGTGKVTGVGSAISLGRLGAMTGPLLTGKILAIGLGTTGILMASLPAVAISAVAVTALSRYKAAHK
ncbi:3-(3-hydroxy-phenyl)propionate transporter MhpT [Acinetobacter sp. ANC 4216]|uniref:3-(3-hydroxy-phenyl)propionate transporter MhpT n=1 Tax=unclassified Acinetobacter TaxID=196816 RepID=UPI00103868E9|nr:MULTISPECIES: 3-(3-hydroxy-phenyl)propionate transporter MhpT [unclassified Acinetobacter]MCT8089134.1 3-(3-hydroxy-phenyl)propionate transporter MhpT [Acinetobacter sp. F_3_1]MCT8097289.1 3-(3-hydroxy-phenyl)propionate transporter MhpT [Acinetobacter sp. C_3_1]MCT8100165.1 3-(3-hydroxy-phenyl)propionate transporter MhpT [Acinetobacter sp. C_4_1]MCT8133355.1 3-(3-hydroxy-phenyl)propionate transporter MhpT [Acinetobacter sp. T_3_1]TCB70156.1 3-(3-hydroxy-phenyl)propionate transporter MhpT [A